MPTVIGKYIGFDKHGQVKEIENNEIDISVGDRCVFIDNSYIDYCKMNKSGQYYAGTQGGHEPQYGTILRIDCHQIAENTCSVLGKRKIEMPIQVKTDAGHLVYCNPLNITKI